MLIAIIALGVGFLGWVLPGQTKLSFAQAIQGVVPTSACNQFDSTTAQNETGMWFQLTAKSNTIIFWLTVVLADNLTNAAVNTAIWENTTVMASNITCGTAPPGTASQISLAPYISAPNANAQFTTTYNFPWTNAVAGTLYTFFVTVSSGVAHAKIVVVAKLGQAIKTNFIGQAI